MGLNGAEEEGEYVCNEHRGEIVRTSQNWLVLLACKSESSYYTIGVH